MKSNVELPTQQNRKLMPLLNGNEVAMEEFHFSFSNLQLKDS